LHHRDLGDAVQEAKRAISLRDHDPVLYDTLAEAEYRSGSLVRAIEAMERALKYSGGDARYAERLKRWNLERETLEGSGGKP
jgi:predicted Zn-dependent protease